jgi:hypothetical protein
MGVLSGLCVVVLTHRSPVVHQDIQSRLDGLPLVVSTDNPAYQYHPNVNFYVEHPLFDRKEDAIGHHVLVAVNNTFNRFEWCSVVLLVEEDARLSRDFANVIGGALPWMINNTYGCFTSMNWAWRDESHKWRPDRLRVVTSTFPEIVWAVSYKLWFEVLLPFWGESWGFGGHFPGCPPFPQR